MLVNEEGGPKEGHLDLCPTEVNDAEGQLIEGVGSRDISMGELQQVFAMLAPIPGESPIAISVWDYKKQAYIRHWADPDKKEFFVWRPMESWHYGEGVIQGPRFYSLYCKSSSTLSRRVVRAVAKAVLTLPIVKSAVPVIQLAVGNQVKLANCTLNRPVPAEDNDWLHFPSSDRLQNSSEARLAQHEAHLLLATKLHEWLPKLMSSTLECLVTTNDASLVWCKRRDT